SATGPRMHVAYLLDSPTYGGAEISVVQLLRHLPAGVRCTVVAPHPVPVLLAAAARRRGELVTVALTDLDRSLRDLDPDLVHAHLIDPASNRTLIEAAGRRRGIATVHMIGHLSDDPTGLRDAYARLFAVIAVSREIAALLIDDLGLPAPLVRRVRNGVEPLPVVERTERTPLVVGGLGRLTAQKGFDLLVQAACRLLAEGHRLRVRIAGEGRDRDTLTRQAAGLPVSLVGFQEDVRRYLASVDLFAMPSRAEALPLALLEAMMTGLPCVATEVGDIRDELDGAVLLIPPEDPDALTAALRRLLTDARLRRDLGERAAALAHCDFRVDRTVSDVHAIYLNVAADTRR
ncbi:MAG: glycosyltransferase family 4 protein, partial [Actinomycetota bacterium]|nr:glycosyltransferase family 4 protein [Actinomycetota bacterium]